MRTAVVLALVASLTGGAAFAAGYKGKKATKAKPAAAKKVAAKKPAAPPKPPKPPKPEVLFTFDDGPSLPLTPKVLDTLDKYGVKAVFFVNGVHFQGNAAWAEKGRALLREELRRGHYVGNHTVNHKFLCGQLGPKIAADEITRNADLIEQATGQRPLLYRTPYGAHCPTLSATLQSLHLKHTGWDIDPEDWKVKNTVIVRDRIIAALKNLRGRAIVLMHDIHKETADAVPQVLEWITNENKARASRGEPQIKILDYSYLLPPKPVPPALPPLIDNLSRLLLATTPPLERAVHWLLAHTIAGAS